METNNGNENNNVQKDLGQPQRKDGYLVSDIFFLTSYSITSLSTYETVG